MPYLELPHGKAYHEVSGAGEPLLFLHGGYSSLEATRELTGLLAEDYEVHGPERPGHGRTADTPEPFAYDTMVRHTLAYLNAIGLARAHVVGFSDGAITGLLLARDHPDRVSSLVAISANLDPTGFVSDEEAAGAMTAKQHEQLEAEYALLSPDGPAHSEVIVGKLVDLWTSEPHIPAASLAGVRAPTLVLAGDHDMVALEHTAVIQRSIPGAQLGIVPGAGHLLVRECPDLIAAIVRRFLTGRTLTSSS